MTEVLIDLHETALREIIPELPVPAGSKVVAAQEHRSASELVALRKSLIVERPVDAAAPVVAPTGPERGGLSTMTRVVGYTRELFAGAGVTADVEELEAAGAARCSWISRRSMCGNGRAWRSASASSRPATSSS